MRIVDIRERSIDLSRFADLSIHQSPLTTSIVAVVTDVLRNGIPIVGYGFGSVGRFAQSGLIRERFAPRLLAADTDQFSNSTNDNIDPFRAWKLMMSEEKAGGHGERCVAVGALDMAIWDAAAKIEDVPLFSFLAKTLGNNSDPGTQINCYAAGGYPYPIEDRSSLCTEIRLIVDRGFTHAKIKIGKGEISKDLRRIDIAAKELPNGYSSLAVDAMNAYGHESAIHAATALSVKELWWFEDICDPLDFDTQSDIAEIYAPPVAAGEALFSLSEAKLLARHGGLRPNHDILVFDPVHCYGLPVYLEIVDHYVKQGWSKKAFWPHGGHQFCQHIVAALGLGGAEVNLTSFQPLCGLSDDTVVVDGRINMSDLPGIGFEHRNELRHLFHGLLETG
ncbi:enolase C-terminal domain-like protein [Brucella anthropi]|uniref:enolase C-terminal domain-like protein n=1 Tax=Brucella anthropi TaxID=529 RepID=UPI0005B86338|nr:enolase C-terminal domain-like protein [Brucella anthropi]KIU66080.1 mandelate racemase [Brucella anthropi]